MSLLTLVHEVGHVWQGYQGAFTWSYVFNSVYYQTSGGAYNYDPGAQWDTYGAEQQAKIIEDWFAGGSSTTDPLYPYITCNVRPGRPHATTVFSTTGSPATAATSSGATATGSARIPPTRPALRTF